MTLQEIERQQIDLDKQRSDKTPVYIVICENSKLDLGEHLAYSSLSTALSKKREYRSLHPRVFCFLLSHEVES